MSALFEAAMLPVLAPVRRKAIRAARQKSSVSLDHVWPLDGAINVVLFAGLGGACQGLEEAGCPVHVANNHDDVALAAHAALNPHTRHIKGDIFDVDPIEATGGRPVKNLWSSPDCRDHSVAKGGAPRSGRVRSLPHQTCRWAAKTRAEVIYVENVREIRGWGPLIAKRDKATGRVLKLDGTVAAKGERVPVQQQQLVRDKSQLGRIFRAWVKHLRALGYHYEDRDLCCADYGVPTSRRRFFAVARRDGRPIVWPERTHAPRDQYQALGLLPWVAAATIIDWSIPLKSIFERERPLAEATLRRVATGMRRYVIDSPRPFIVPITHTGPARIYPVDETMRTLTTAHRGEMSLVVPTIVGAGGRAAQVPAMDPQDPLNTTTTKEDRLLACAHLTKFTENSPGQDLAAPIDTVMAGAPKFGLVGAYIAEHRGNSIGQDPDAPLGCQTAVPHHAVVGGFMAAYHSQKRDGEDRCHQAADPLPTQTTENRFAVVGATMVQTGYGEREGQAPRALDIEEPIGTQMAGGAKHAVVGAFMAQHNSDPRKNGEEAARPGRAAGEPLGTITTSTQIGVVGAEMQSAAWMVQHNLGAVGHEPAEPLSTITTTGSQQNVAAAYLAQLRGTATALDAENPLPAQTSGGYHTAAVAAFLTKYYSSGKHEQDVADPLDTLTTKARFGVVTVTIDGQPYVITDIGMRMLQPSEQAAAHELKLPVTITIDGKVRPLTKTEQTRLIGNSVPKRMAKLLAACNAVHALSAPSVAAE